MCKLNIVITMSFHSTGSFEQMRHERERLLVEKCAAVEERCTQVKLECDSLRDANADLKLSLDKEKV